MPARKRVAWRPAALVVAIACLANAGAALTNQRRNDTRHALVRAVSALRVAGADAQGECIAHLRAVEESIEADTLAASAFYGSFATGRRVDFA